MICLLELVVDICANGGCKKAFSRHFRPSVEVACQIMNIVGITLLAIRWHDTSDYNQILKPFEICIFIRLLKLLSLVEEIRSLRLIM